MSKSLCIIVFYRSSTWLEPSVKSLLESSIAELSLNSKLLSISEFLLKSPIAEFSLDPELYLISIPWDLGSAGGYILNIQENTCSKSGTHPA